MYCRVGQQSQDGGETVQLLLDVLWKLLIFFIPVKKTNTSESSWRCHIHSFANITKLMHVFPTW